MEVLEIGCARGRELAWAATTLKAKVSGLDYSERGIALSKELLNALKIEGDLRCEDVYSTTFASNSFDLVYSLGVIEHFNEPTALVRIHVALLKPGGIALITVPNYGGIYGRLQRYFDAENLALHNLNIMTCKALAQLAPVDLASEVHAFETGRINTGLLSLHKKWPPMLAKLLFLLFNGLGLLQPFDIPSLSPLLALKIVRVR